MYVRAGVPVCVCMTEQRNCDFTEACHAVAKNPAVIHLHISSFFSVFLLSCHTAFYF